MQHQRIIRATRKRQIDIKSRAKCAPLPPHCCQKEGAIERRLSMNAETSGSLIRSRINNTLIACNAAKISSGTSIHSCENSMVSVKKALSRTHLCPGNRWHEKAKKPFIHALRKRFLAMYDAYYTPLLCKCEPETTGFRFDKNLCVRSVNCGLIPLVDFEHDAETWNRKGTACDSCFGLPRTGHAFWRCTLFLDRIVWFNAEHRV